MVTVVFFASLRERLGCQREQVELPASGASVKELIELLEQRHPDWLGILTASNIKVACNQQICDLDARVNAGDEVAFFPPVTGG